MASGRMIHKTVSTSETLATVDIQARYMYIGTIIHSDDDGRMKASPAFLKALLFPFDHNVRVETIKDWREQLTASGLISLYAVDGKEYLYHPNWKQWQSIRKDRYNPSDCPHPSNENEMATDWQPSVNQATTQPNLTQPNLTKKETSASPPISMWFEDVWGKYPNKDGKKLAERSFRASVKTEKDYTDIQKALDNYLKSEKVMKGFVKNGSTWFNNWRDWINNPVTKKNDDGIPEEWKTPQPIRR